MNEKIGIQQLADSMVERHNMKKEDAEEFVKGFFKLIEEALGKDKYVKIKGLGTFKLIEVDSRESINVNTGERIRIEGHTKISFTPESSLKDLINKPFAHFETVILNEGVTFDDLSEVEEGSTTPTPTPTEEVQQAPPVTIQAENTELPQEQAESAEETNSEEKPLEKEISPEEQVEEIKENNHEEECNEIENKPQTEMNRKTSVSKLPIAIMWLAILLCGGILVYLYWPSPQQNPPQNQIAKVDTIAKVVVEDTLVLVEEKEETVDSISKQLLSSQQQAEPRPTTPVAKPVMAVNAPFKADSTSYKIVGTKATHTIKSGETLTKVSLRYYGTKALWPYIVKHNKAVIKNPDNVPYGTTIKIPELEKKQ